MRYSLFLRCLCDLIYSYYHAFNIFASRIKSLRREESGNDKQEKPPEHNSDGKDMSMNEILENEKLEVSSGSSFLAKLAIAVGIAVTITIISVGVKPENSLGPSLGIQFLAESLSSSSAVVSPPPGFSFKAFGYKILLPEYAPGYSPNVSFNSILLKMLALTAAMVCLFMHKHKCRWIYFWLLMAAGCGLFISEEALNIWVCPLHWYFCFTA